MMGIDQSLGLAIFQAKLLEDIIYSLKMFIVILSDWEGEYSLIQEAHRG